MNYGRMSSRGIIPWLVLIFAVLAAALFMARGQLRPHATEPDAYRYVVGVSQPNLSEPWRVAMNDEIRQEIAKHSEIRVIFTDAAQSSTQQVQDVDKLMGYGIDLLIISLDDPLSLTPKVSEVYKKIPVIVLGRGVTGYDYTLYIGTDDEMIGRKAGEFAAETLGTQGGRVVEIQGLKGSPTVNDRSEGFREGVANHPLQIVKTLNADWQRDKAEDELSELLHGTQDIDLVFAQNETMALGAYRALHKAGLGRVPIIGIDGVNSENGSKQLVAENKLTGTFTSPTGGREAIRYALDILSKEKGIPKKVILRSQKITADAVDAGSSTLSLPLSPKNRSAPITIGFAQVGAESEWRLAHTKSVIHAAEDAGYRLLFENAEQSQEKQIAIIRSFIAQKVDVIAFSPKTETGWDEVLGEAKRAGIPVILSDREVRVSDDSLWTSYIGSDFREEGRRAARWLAVEAKPGRQYRIVELQGTEGAAPTLGRKTGFDEVLHGDDRFVVEASLQGDFTRASGKQQMAQALRRFGKKIDVVYSHNDDMALGAIEAIESFGLRPGKDIMIISVDATKPALKAMSVGKLNLAVECNPLLGPQLMKAVKDLTDGRELPMKIITAEGVFPQDVAKKVLANREY